MGGSSGVVGVVEIVGVREIKDIFFRELCRRKALTSLLANLN